MRLATGSLDKTQCTSIIELVNRIERLETLQPLSVVLRQTTSA